MTTLREFLSDPESIPDEYAFYYLSPEVSRWTLETKGVFSLDSVNFAPDSDEHLPKEVKEDGWVSTLDKNIVEEIIFNAGEYKGERTLEELLQAFIFYYENDAFMEFEE